MEPARRLTLLGLTAAGLTGLVGCGRTSVKKQAGPVTLDVAALTAGYGALARRAKPGVLGLGVALVSAPTEWVSDADARFPMQSVFKAFLAAAALAQVDAGTLRLAQPVTLTDADRAPFYSAIGKVWKAGDLTLPVVDLMALAVQRSDNIAADALMKRIGGPAAVQAWLTAKGIAGVRVDRYEHEVQPDSLGLGPFQPAWIDPKAWQAARDAVPPAEREAAAARYLADPRDTATLPGALAFLTRLEAGQLLAPASTRLLLRLMTDASTGEARLRAGLPKGAALAHKSGSSATILGLTPATNDIGLVTLSNGRRLAIAAFLAGSTATDAARDRLLADAASLAVASLD